MKKFLEILLTIAVLGGILVISAFITNAYARAMYNRCKECGTLNAKRRAQCRQCSAEIVREVH